MRCRSRSSTPTLIPAQAGIHLRSFVPRSRPPVPPRCRLRATDAQELDPCLRRDEGRGAWLIGVTLFALAACSSQPAPAPKPSPTGLEAAAIAAGVVQDPNATDPTGLYARDTDRLCVVPGDKDLRVGVTVDYDDQQGCAGGGTATHAGETLHVRLGPDDACAFDARFEGDRIMLPGALPEACAKLCRGRASLAGLSAERLSGSASEAGALRDGRGRLLCAG